jgi:hypothetical protein
MKNNKTFGSEIGEGCGCFLVIVGVGIAILLLCIGARPDDFIPLVKLLK